MADTRNKETQKCIRVQGDVESHLEWVECKIESWPTWKKEIVESSCSSVSSKLKDQIDKGVSV